MKHKQNILRRLNISLSVSILMLFLFCTSGICAEVLTIEYKGDVIASIDEDGNLERSLVEPNTRGVPDAQDLVIENDGVAVLWIKNQDRKILSTGMFNRNVSVFPETGFSLFNQRMERIVHISPTGRFLLRGTAQTRKLVQGVTYIDNTAVFEWDGTEEKYELAYQNIYSPEGLEGKIEATNNGMYYYLTDHLGSIRQIISENGDLAAATSYHSYGDQEAFIESGVTARESFTGKELDRDGEDGQNGVAGLQLYYFGARFFDPETGIWNGVDPADRLVNPYAYCGYNPVAFIDPNGEDFGLSAIIVGAVIGAAISSASYTFQAQIGNQEWTWEGLGTSALAGGVSGAVAAPIGAAVGAGMSSLTSGWSSGLAAAAITGATAGAASGFAGGFTSGLILSGGDFGAAFSGAGWGALGGGAVGGASGAINYGIQYRRAKGASFKEYNKFTQNQIKRHFKYDSPQYAVDYAVDAYDIPGNFSYQEFPGSANKPLNIRGITESGNNSTIYKEAFYRPEFGAYGDVSSGRFDASSLVNTIAHEGYHQARYIDFFPSPGNQHASLYPKNMYLKAVHEVGAYSNNYINATSHGLSRQMTDYVYSQFRYYANNLAIIQKTFNF